jgi:GT2 family glycosyltransferase
MKASIFKDKIFPPFSKRRLLAKLLYTFMLNPFKFVSKIRFKRIILFFKVLRAEGTTGVLQRVNKHILNNGIPLYTQKIHILKSVSPIKKISDCERLVFKKEDSPTVSIIIPVYNKFNYTYNCLKSILDCTGDEVSYEIIIADDLSHDLTVQIKEAVSNINVVRATENIGFLNNCNNAAKHAKGKYILLLNNDTQVQENWLLPLVELIEKDISIGAVGSKLVYENGMLQEAGGIMWKDASAWNYGRMSDPALPEFNYVKEVDYISGASLMVRRGIWEKLGGFDGSFAPAYYEDTDICFSIRKLGYKVMYQPDSTVVHFEGISNGTNIKGGLKRYQAINQKKFFDKWKNLLESEYPPNGMDPFHARDRSRNKNTILFIDHYVPMYDKDAGSRAVYHYIQLFVDLGYNVKFIGDNYYRHEPYTTVLNQLGVEVLYGNYYFKNWQLWIRQNSDYINIVFMNRPHISCKYVDFLKQFPKIKIAYWGHDLHFLRENREYEITKDSKLVKSSEKWKKIEFDIMEKANVSYFFSQVEINIIKSISADVNARAIPINIYKNIKKKDTPFRERKDLLFVGGFSHTPNVDAILWLCGEIMPFVKAKYPDIKLNIVGSNVPEKVIKLESETVIVKGYVTDDELQSLYDSARISVVPLRYGAGVKGKIIEAIYNQLPVITTPIGAEGILNAETVMLIKDSADGFAGEIIRLYNDFEALEDKSNRCYHYIRENFSEDAALRVLREDGMI